MEAFIFARRLSPHGSWISVSDRAPDRNAEGFDSNFERQVAGRGMLSPSVGLRIPAGPFWPALAYATSARNGPVQTRDLGSRAQGCLAKWGEMLPRWELKFDWTCSCHCFSSTVCTSGSVIDERHVSIMTRFYACLDLWKSFDRCWRLYPVRMHREWTWTSSLQGQQLYDRRVIVMFTGAST